MQPLLAHEKWFIDPNQFPLRFDLTFKPQPLAFIGAVLLATIVAALIWRARQRRDILPGAMQLGADANRLAGFYGLVPAILGVHLAVPLLINGMQRTLFSVNNHMDGAWGYFASVAEVGCALSFVYGGLTRLAAVVLALLWVAGAFMLGPQPMLDNFHMLGFAAFFFLAGRGPIAIDRLIFPKLEPSARLMRWAMPALRICLGISLIVVAFTEKFANLPMGLAFLKMYPLNFTPHLGMPMSDQLFLLCAASVELLIGFWVTLGLFPREVLIVAWMPFNLTLTYFNWTSVELIGHLPIYGAMAVLLIWDPAGEHVPLFVKGLREGPLKILEDFG